MGSRAARAEALDGAGESVSVSEEEESASQVSATGLDFGFCAGLSGEVGERARWVRVEAISGAGVLEGIGEREKREMRCTVFAGCLVDVRHGVVNCAGGVVCRWDAVGFAG
jgi:hypothetical protein